MFYNIRVLKKLHLNKQKNLFIHLRYMNVIKFTFLKKNIFIKNSLTWIKYNNKIFNTKYKYGMFAFTRKPFAKPTKKSSNKKR